MSTGKVILVTIIVSIITSAATYFGLQAFTSGELLAGQSKVLVPPLRNLRPDQARKMLEPKGLLLVVTERKEDPRVEEGLIASQTPLEGSEVLKGAEVKVAVSTGMAQLEVPALSGQPLTAALQAITSAGLKAGTTTRQAHDSIARDQVIASAPAAGQKVPKGTVVNLVVSEGPQAAEVPKVTFRGLTAARKALTDAGFNVGKVSYISDEDRAAGVVLSQTPAAGASAPKGSAVDLVVNSAD